MDDLKAIVEALVFVSESPVKIEQLAEALDLEKPKVGVVLLELCREYEENDRGFELQRVAGGYQFRTRARHAEWVRRLSRAKPFRFSRAAMETLAIIAYRQPVTRADIEYLRGVDSGGVLKTLLDKRLVRILGKKDIPGRPMIYGTSRDFLELFGLNDLSGLPTLKEFDQLSLDLPPLEGAADGSQTP